ncbi:MAG: hypothetical protein AABW82_00275 [Nanoarchaeota archaeon]
MKKPFVFEDHIIRFVHPEIAIRERKRKFRSELSTWLADRYAERKLNPLKNQQREDDQHYRLSKKAFDDMLSQGRVDIEHKIFHNNTHKLILTGSGIERLSLRKRPKYDISPDRREKSTVLFVDMGNKEGEIKLYDYPRSRESLGELSRITIDYSFSTEISLGGELSCDGQTFTDSPNQRAEFYGNRSVGFFYGNPGKVFLRFGDATSNELQRAVLGTWIYNDVVRDKLKIEGEISLGDEVIYHGNFDTTGSFPFYIDEDRSGDRARTPDPDLVGKY